MTNNKFEEFTLTLQEIALFAKVFSHPARIAIIELLAKEKEIKTGDISDSLPISRTTVTQHLKELKELGIIKGTIDGLKIHYCLDIERLKEIKTVLDDFFDQTTKSFLCECE
ncbi:MAG: metalloregulator ArsR/SmtB family transcription factor [Ignavibacteriae bacterium]|nr:metalloregulator ArsR/SmtB family transcription factor [Ignavibacteriota bacterium]